MKQVLFFVLLVFTTCNGQKKMSGSTTEKEEQDSDTGLTWVASYPYSGADQAETLIIMDAKGLQKFYSQINRTRKPPLPAPDIDFSKEMVVVRCSGKTDSGTLPTLYITEETGKQMVLGIGKTDKKHHSSAITTPFSVYRMPMTKKEIVVRE